MLFFYYISFDFVVFLKTGKIIYAYTALIALRDLFYIVLKAFKVIDVTIENYDVIAINAHFAIARNFAACDICSGYFSGGRQFEDVIKEITSIVDGPISGEVKATTTDAEGMIKEGREIAKIHENMVVKIPTTIEGLKATKVLSSEGIKTNLTLIFNPNQALLAARAGATYVSPFLGRLDDISQNGLDLIADIKEIFDMAGDIDTQIICASVRNPIHVMECAKMGADIATVPYNVFEQMMKHPLTDQGIEKFQADYKAVFGE